MLDRRHRDLSEVQVGIDYAPDSGVVGVRTAEHHQVVVLLDPTVRPVVKHLIARHFDSVELSDQLKLPLQAQRTPRTKKVTFQVDMGTDGDHMRSEAVARRGLLWQQRKKVGEVDLPTRLDAKATTELLNHRITFGANRDHEHMPSIR
ncbi:hypothetical protein [Ilumatobacter sp.]|uniref:hypothetical protein n=1 Tax=Ilumatobacter sp. TaxID=1967498 RepID=UPI003752F4B9